jgi:hypothetical protein
VVGVAVGAADHAGGDHLAPVWAEPFDAADSEDVALVEDGVAGADEFGLATGADVEAAAIVDVAPFRLGWRGPGVVVDVAAGATALAVLAEDHCAADVAVRRVKEVQLVGRCRSRKRKHGGNAREKEDPLHSIQDKAIAAGTVSSQAAGEALAAGRGSGSTLLALLRPKDLAAIASR